MKTILIAIPTNKYIEPETFKSIYDLIVPEGYQTQFQFFYGYQIDQIRNLIADWGKKYDYLFCVDSDIILPTDTLVKMILHDKDIISGLYIQRIVGTHTLEIYTDNDTGGVTNIPYRLVENQGLIEISACGMGCCLIKGEVLRKMEYPHFVYKSAIEHRNTVSEDVYFCKKARSLGFSVWADVSIKCDHVGKSTFKVDTDIKQKMLELSQIDYLPKEHTNYLNSMSINPKVIYDIGASVLHWTRKAKDRWPDAQLFLMDATPECECIYQTQSYPYAIEVLSDQNGKTLKFYNDPYNVAGNSYYKENTIHYNESHAQIRTTKTLDTLAEERNWPLPDLIKLDVQGAELDILKGAKNTLQKCKDIILEAQVEDYNEGAPKENEVIEYMNSIGFLLVSKFSTNLVDGDYHFRKV